MEHARHVERDVQQLEAELRQQQMHTALLRDVALASRGAADPQQVFETIYQRLVEVLPLDAFFVALCDREGADEYRFVLFVDEGERYDLPDTRVGGLTGHLLRHKQPLLFRDLHREYQQQAAPPPERFGRIEKRSRSWMGVPLLIGREAIGVISAQSYTPGLYDEHHLELLSALGELAAIAVENALLYQAQDQLSSSLAARVAARSEELAVLTAIAISFSQGQPLAVLLDEVLERVLWLLGMDAGAIYLHERRDSLRRIASRNGAEQPEPRVLLSTDDDTPEALALRDGQLAERVSDTGATLIMPLRAHGQTVGVMTLHGPARVLTEHERTLIEAASYQIAVGVENARLLQDREREIARLEALTNIAAASASTLDFQQMFERVATTLRPLLHFDGFLAAAYDAEHNAIISGIGWSLERDVQPVDHLALDQPSRLAQMVRQREPLLLRHTDPLHYQLQPQQFWERGALSWLGVPLLSRNNEPIGVLAIQSARPHAFGQRDLRFLNAVARQLALNVENAQLYLTARTSAVVAEQRADNLTLVHSISRLVNSSLDPQEVLGIAAEELVKLFGVDHCGIVVYNTPGWIGEIVAEFPPLGVRGQRVAFQNVDDFREDMQYIGQPIVIHDALQDIRTRPIHGLLHQHEVRAMLIVPLISRGRAVGAIGLNQRTEGRSFSPEELELCRTIAAQVAIALENARLFQLSVTRVEQEMEIARSIQANLFPTVLPTIPGADLAVRCIPARETGGDFYDVLPLEGGRYGLSVGDVSGKSLPAAMLMAVARSVVRSEALDHALPDDVMCQTNTLIAQDVPPDSYVALCYAVYDSQRRTVDLAIGGQLTPLLRHADGSVEFVDAVHDLPLGIAGDVRYTSTHIQLVPGDTLLLYTDGLVEAFSPQREIFGFDRLQQTFGACGDCPAVETVERLLGAVRDWQNGAPRSDDITAVVLRIT